MGIIVVVYFNLGGDSEVESLVLNNSKAIKLERDRDTAKYLGYLVFVISLLETKFYHYNSNWIVGYHEFASFESKIHIF